MMKPFPPRERAHSIALSRLRRTRHPVGVIAVLVLVQSVGLAALGWDAPAVISIVVASVATLRSNRIFCPLDH